MGGVGLVQAAPAKMLIVSILIVQVLDVPSTQII